MDIGIIGGADGPTAVFVGGEIGGTIALFVGIILVIALIVFIIRRRKKK